MGIIHLLSRLKKTLYSILSLCSLAWITSALTFASRSSTEENTHMLLSKQDKNSDDEELRDELRRIRDINTSSINKLYRFEEKIGNLETDFSGEKELWRTKFQELFADKEILKEQQKKYVHLEETTSEKLRPQNADSTDGLVESNVDIRDGVHRRVGEQVKAEHGKTWACVNEYTSLEGPSSLKCSPISYHDGTNAQKASKCFRVFVPHSPFDLNIGSRVKILLPSGKVGTGIVYKVGHLPGKDELQVGVDLESQECWQHLSKFKVQHKFHSDPPSGVQVPFSKVLMVWE